MRVTAVRYNYFYERLLGLDLFPADFVSRDLEFIIEQVHMPGFFGELAACGWLTCLRRAAAFRMDRRWTRKARSRDFSPALSDVLRLQAQ